MAIAGYTYTIPGIELFTSLDYRNPWPPPGVVRSGRDLEIWLGPLYLCISAKKRKHSNERPDDTVREDAARPR